MTVNDMKTYLEAPSVDRPIETLKLGVREVLGAYHRRQEVFVNDLPASAMWLPGNDVPVLRVADDVMKFGREVRLNGALGAITVVVFRRYLHLRVIPVSVVNHRLLNLDLLPFPWRIVVVWVHHGLCVTEVEDVVYDVFSCSAERMKDTNTNLCSNDADQQLWSM